MRLSSWFIVGSSVLLGAWLVFDGLRAVILGDYVTPATGTYAGRLGPWSDVLAAVGIDPRSLAVKGFHILNGIILLISAGATLLGLPWAWYVTFMAALVSLWYLPFGTVIAIAQIGVLIHSHDATK